MHLHLHDSKWLREYLIIFPLILNDPLSYRAHSIENL